MWSEPRASDTAVIPANSQHHFAFGREIGSSQGILSLLRW